MYKLLHLRLSFYIEMSCFLKLLLTRFSKGISNEPKISCKIPIPANLSRFSMCDWWGMNQKWSAGEVCLNSQMFCVRSTEANIFMMWCSWRYTRQLRPDFHNRLLKITCYSSKLHTWRSRLWAVVIFAMGGISIIAIEEK